jgi:hypothetical protein
MKKTLLLIALIMVAGISSTFANDNDGINKSVKLSFSRDFGHATNISWQRKTKMVKATFSLDDQILFAYYEPTGILVAVSKNITTENLPISLQADLKTNYSSYWISDLFENASKEETDYYVTLENADKKVILQSSGTEGWVVFKTISKDTK